MSWLRAFGYAVLCLAAILAFFGAIGSFLWFGDAHPVLFVIILVGLFLTILTLLFKTGDNA